MSSSTQTDINYLSCSSNTWGLYEGSDHPTPCAPPSDGVVLSPPNPLSYAGILKLCDNSTVTLRNITVEQGYESSVDINNHANVNLQGVFGTSQCEAGDQIFSVKGGSIATLTGTLRGSGIRMGADVLVDNWSDQSYSGSIVDLANVKHETGRKIVVVKRYGASKVNLGANAQVAVFQSLKLTAYWWFKWLVRKILGIKVGQKGPSWL